MAPICVSCQRFYRPEKNGFTFLEGMPVPPSNQPMARVLPGTAHAEYWKPYKLWRGDLWKCEGCGHLIISGVPRLRMSEHYMPSFDEHVKQYATRYEGLPFPYQVNDCC